MKTIFRYIILCAALSFTAGCVQEEIAEDFSVEITARIDAGADTRTTLSGLEDGMYYPLWSAGDEIAVYADSDKDPSKFTLISGTGTKTASFSGTRSGQDYLAVYPYDIAGTVSDGTVSVTIPAVQKYVKDSFGPGAFPMIAAGSSKDGLTFMNLCSVLKVTFTGKAAVRSVTLKANDKNTFMSGPASAVTGHTAEAESLLTMSAGGSDSVMLETKGLEVSEDSPADVYIVIPSQTYKGGFTIEVDTYTEKVTKKISSDLTFERSQIRAIKDFRLDSEVPAIIPEAVPDNEIWYETQSQTILYFAVDSPFNANIVSNEYSSGVGVITFDAPVTEIRSSAFAYQQDLTSVFLPSSIEKIGVSAFYGCVNLETAVINSEGLSIEEDYSTSNPFQNCCKLSEFKGPLSSEDGRCLIIDESVYSFAPAGIEEYTVPSGVKTIKKSSFAETELKIVTLPEGLEGIETHAFQCKSYTDTQIESSLEYVYLPSTLKYVDGYAFIYNNQIKAFYGDNEFVTDDNKALVASNYNGTGYKTLFTYASGSDAAEYTVPEGVEAIESYAFYYATALKKLTFPDSFERIFSGHAFEGTTNIEEISGKYVLDDKRSMVVDGTLVMVAGAGLTKYVTPDAATVLAAQVLGFKDDIVEYVISDSVTEVEGYGYLFNQSPNVETITVSARMSYLGYDPFDHSLFVTPKLKTVYCRAPIPPVVYHNTGVYDFEDLTIYVPEESLDLYKSSSGWKPYEKYLKPYDYGDLSEFYPDCYISSDYSQDGKVKTLQTASKGNGIDIVLMGDAYSDREIADGSYEDDMEYMYEKLFTEEPFMTHKDMFNVYYVNVVSMTEGYDYAGAALGGYFGDGTLVGGNDNKCFEYAMKAVSEERMDEVLIIVAMNSNAYAGTCYMYYPGTVTGTYGSGPAVAYFPKGDNPETFAQLLHHEANGHGFSKLADEYAYENMGAIPEAEVTATRDQQTNWGWWKNVDFTSDPEQVRWSYFLEDTRYADEGLGVFEGGLTYWNGVWRSTENSIMRYNTGGFNAPSREAIYYRIHKLAYGDAWEYDYEEFVKYDAINRASSASAPQKSRRNYVEKPLEPTAAPVVVRKSWREAR